MGWGIGSRLSTPEEAGSAFHGSPPALQGRVFAILVQLMFIVNPLSYLLTGVLVDYVLEPAVGGPAWRFVAPLVGSQPGSGMGLLMLVAGLLMFVSTALVYAWPRARRAEVDIPDMADI